MAEAESEDTEGKALVMLVVLNRVWDDEFPDTIEEVIFQKGQFSPISNEALCKAPDEDKMRLAIACQMNGIDVRDIETGLANVLTGVQKAIKPAIEYYRYLGGK